MQNSPFSLFRRYEKKLMVALTAMAMFAFLFLDSATAGQGKLPVATIAILVAAFCAAGMWFIGAPRQQGKQFALAGAAVGALVAWVGLSNAGPPAIVRTNSGNLTSAELQTMSSKRSVAERFVALAAAKGGTRGDLSFGGMSNDSLIHAFIMANEAKAAGVAIDDEGVNAFIRSALNNKPTSRQAFRELLQDVGISESDLFSILRSELSARLMGTLVTPPRSANGISLLRAPADLWQQYQRLNVKQELSAAVLPVSEFLVSVTEPSEADVAQFFEAHKNSSPQPDGRPGFFQPPKAKLEYLVADDEQFEQKAGQPTDEEIADYYNKNKERFRLDRQIPDQPDAPAGPSPTVKSPAGESPADGELPSTGKPDGDAKPPGDSAGGDQAGSDAAAPTPTTPDTVTPEPVVPEKGPVEEPAPPQSRRTGSPRSNPLQLVSASRLIEADEADSEQPATATTQKTPNETAPAETPAAEATAPTEPIKEAPQEPGTPAATPPAVSIPAATPASTNPPLGETQYRPLESVRSDIEELILKERTRGLAATAIGAAYNEMSKLADEYRALPDEAARTAKAPEFSVRLKAYAEANGLTYVETKPISENELRARTDLFGSATAPGPTARGGTTPDVASVVFSTRATHTPLRADEPGGFKQFSYWKTAIYPPKVPALTDDGIRDEVVKAWKFEKARLFAQKRAETLADLAKQATGKPLEESLAGQTLLGTEDSPPLKVTTTNRFSWLTLGASAANPFWGANKRPQLGTVDNIPGVGQDFMKLVFDKMNVGDVAPTVDMDRSVFYVVRVNSRDEISTEPDPSDPLRLTADRFLAGPKFGSLPFFLTEHDYLSAEESQAVMTAWAEQFKNQHAIEYEEPQPQSTPGQ